MVCWDEAPGPNYLQILEVSQAVLIAISQHQPEAVKTFPEPAPDHAEESMQAATAAALPSSEQSPTGIHALSVQAAIGATVISPIQITAARSKRLRGARQAGLDAKKRKLVREEIQPQLTQSNSDTQSGQRVDDASSGVLLMEAAHPTIPNRNEAQPDMGGLQQRPLVGSTAKFEGYSSSSLNEESWRPPVQHPRAGFKRCLACKLTFRNLLAFQSHFDEKHFDDASESSDLCAEETSSGVLVCGECGGRVKRVHFAQHCNRHRGTHFECPGCGAQYRRSQYLYRHQARAKPPCSQYEPTKKNGKYVRQKLVRV